MSLILAVYLSGVLKSATWSCPAVLRTTTFGFMTVSKVNRTSFDVKGAPSCHVTSRRKRNVHTRPFSVMPPLATLGVSVARFGMNRPVLSIFQGASKTEYSTAVSTPVLT